MDTAFQVIKSSGRTEPFDPEKLRRSLRRSGAGESVVNQVMQELAAQLQPGMRTKAIYRRAFKLLQRVHRPAAARYTLKQSLFDFGESGFPFEDFFAEVMKAYGYRVRTRQVLDGACIRHEVDVVAESADRLVWVECKYHPRAGSVSDVKIPLYVHSRFRDLEQYRTVHRSIGDHRPAQGWIVTNTRFSDEAMTYGRCADLVLIGWNYPSGASLRELVDQAGLYPLTCLTTLTRREKIRLLEKGIVLSRQLTRPGYWSDLLNLPGERQDRVMAEARDLTEANPAVYPAMAPKL